jgi:hypothetical protein
MSGEVGITVSREFIRDLAIACMDDSHGINENGFGFLATLCEASDNTDVTEAADAVDGRFFLPEDWGQEQG